MGQEAVVPAAMVELDMQVRLTAFGILPQPMMWSAWGGLLAA